MNDSKKPVLKLARTTGAGTMARLEAEVEALRRELALSQKRVRELTVLADQDPMLSVLNRRAFVRELSRAVAARQRHGHAAVLVYLDVDGLKGINDEHGHCAGDQLLTQVGSILTAHIRQTDAVGRLGGDEFGMLLAFADREGAELKMARLGKKFEAEACSWNGVPIPLKVTYGLCEIDGGKSAEEVLSAADAAMYARRQAREAAG
ncbi:GGDEF domain-containing protein [Parvularcula oceani]|uniref:GGDEF domain-containing protein n=1 Tax=Parvularcula oceani TaxID=1247963 RepID=UPI000690A69B|nr:GGDEF domain-containing protein [Parvularcula oceani]